MLGLTGKYQLEARLGGGGMAEVFIGKTTGVEGFSRRVAIKRVLAGFSENPDFARMFVAEAQLTSRLQHPNIVSVLDFDRDAEKRLFLVMELVEGKDLDDLMATGLLPFPVVIYVVCEMLRGLGYAHNLPAGDGGPRGIIHRDVSPHNVLLSWEGAVKVSDFGIAKARSASNATASVFIKGKPAYMSPEQANGTNLDGRSDLFAAGIMLWELLVGHRLFVGGTTQETLAKVLFLQVPWPRQHRAGVPEDVERVAMRLLERDPNHRYHSAEDAIADLLQCALAPKSGRDELMNAMAERFPQQAPVRTVRRSIPPGATPRAVSDGASAPVALPYGGGASAAVPAPYAGGGSVSTPYPGPGGGAVVTSPFGSGGSAPSAAPVVVPGQPTPPPGGVPTVPGSPLARSGPHAATVLGVRQPTPVGAVMSADTRTLGPAPAAARAVAAVERSPATTPRSSWIVVGLALSGLLALIVVVALSGGGKAPDPAPGSGSGSGLAVGAPGASTDAAAPAPLPTTLDAAVAAVVDAQPTLTPLDAAVAGVVGVGTRPSSGCTFDRTSRERGTLAVFVEPWAMVEVDGKKVGQTPQSPTLAPGCHVVKLSNPDLGKNERLKVEIRAGETRTVERTWR
ncbi:MAG: protein kinase [Kofleriaceae bacterium]|nr:protein kinase [Kofleriaceae bacterium]